MKSRLQEIRELLRLHLPFLKERFAVSSLSLFGSYVRQAEHVGSDLDVLVRFDRVPGLLGFIELENYLSDILGVKVDLVMDGALKPSIGVRVRQEAVPV